MSDCWHVSLSLLAELCFAVTELRQLDLQHNSISGSLPRTVGRLVNLLYLNLKDNTRLGGPLPVATLSQLTKLNRLSLVHCDFAGNDLGQALNQLQSQIPRCKIWM